MDEMKAVGLLLVIGALLAGIGFVIHPENPGEVDALMATVADNEGVWRASHMLIGFGMTLSIAALAIWCFGPTGHGMSPLLRMSLVLVAVGFLTILPVVGLEATTSADAAAAGDSALFNTLYNVGLAAETFMLVAVLGMVLAGIAAITAPGNGIPNWGGGLAVLGGVGAGVGGVTENFTIIQYAVPVFLLFLVWNGVNMFRGTTAPRATKSAAAT